MALTAFESAEQRLPCHVDQAVDAASKAVAAGTEQAVPLQEKDHGGATDQRPAERDDIWNMIQSQKPAAPALAPNQAPYVPAPVRRSSSLLTQKSLEICTESLGSETGSDGFSDADSSCPGSDEDADCKDGGANWVAAAHSAPARAFPPPLPSLARRTVGSLQMRQHRRDGRLVVEAVPVLSNTLFRAQRRGGRLLLSFADTAAPASDVEKNSLRQEELNQPEAEEETEEEVHVVDRGTVVEVKVSTQPQAHSALRHPIRRPPPSYGQQRKAHGSETSQPSSSYARKANEHITNQRRGKERARAALPGQSSAAARRRRPPPPWLPRRCPPPSARSLLQLPLRPPPTARVASPTARSAPSDGRWRDLI